MKKTVNIGIFKISTLVVDLLLVYGSLILAFILERTNLQDYQRNFQGFKMISPYIGIVYIIFMYIYGLEKTTRQSFGEIVYSIALTCISLFVGIIVLAFFIRGSSKNDFSKVLDMDKFSDIPPVLINGNDLGALSYPRTQIAIGVAILFVVLTIWRYFVWKLKKKMHGVKPTIVIGKENAIRLSKKIILKHRDLYGVKYISSEADEDLFKHLEECSSVFITSEIEKEIKDNVLKHCINNDKSYYFIPNILSITTLNSYLSKVDDIPTYRVKNMELNQEDRLLKRLIDIVFSALALIILSPVFLVVSIIIKTDGGSAFYKQERVTKNGKIFKIYKFRSMCVDAETKSGPVLAQDNDPRITKIGKIMRSTRIDELPQFINILKGEMSLVGPRPERPFFVNQFEEDMPEYIFRKKVKSGLTGMAQILGKYNTRAQDKLRYDLIYIENYSLLLDFKLMFQTLQIILKRTSTEGVMEEDSMEDIIKKLNLEIKVKIK